MLPSTLFRRVSSSLFWGSLVFISLIILSRVFARMAFSSEDVWAVLNMALFRTVQIVNRYAVRTTSAILRCSLLVDTLVKPAKISRWLRERLGESSFKILFMVCLWGSFLLQLWKRWRVVSVLALHLGHDSPPWWFMNLASFPAVRMPSCNIRYWTSAAFVFCSGSP